MGAEVLVLLGSLEPTEPLRSTLAFLSWASRTPGTPPLRIVARHAGTAADRVRALAPTAVIYDPQGWTVPRIAQRLHLNRASAALRAADLRYRLRAEGAVYVADVRAAPLLHRLSAGAGPVVTHLHASDQELDRLDDVDRSVLLARTDRWIVGTADQVAQLVDLGVDAAAIATAPDLLDLPGMGEAGPDLVDAVRAQRLERHGIPVDARLVLGIGSEDWWTVPDAFVRVGWETVHRPGGEDVHLLWLAEGATERMLWPLRHDIRHAGLEHRVHVDTGGRPVWQQLAAADALLLTRLGDHTPTGQREAALMGRPVLWFDDPEAAEPPVPPDAGTSVPFLDVRAMADAVVATVSRSPEGTGGAADVAADQAAWLPSVGGRAILAQLSATR